MKDKIEIYTTRDNETAVEVRFDKETVWLSQEQLTLLFQRDQSVISRHINNVFKEGELEKKSNMQKMHIAKSDKPVVFYNLEGFGKKKLYPTFEEKAATLLYLIVKNHAFIDGNKRIAAACFLLFLQANDRLGTGEMLAISNEALASLTLFVAVSKSNEMETVKQLIVSILNRSQ